jgi:hypothetical protein
MSVALERPLSYDNCFNFGWTQRVSVPEVYFATLANQ